MNIRTIILLSILTATLSSYGQKKVVEKSNVYELALIKLVDRIEKSHRCLINGDTLIIWTNRYVSSKLPTKINRTVIIYSDYQSKYPIRNNDSGFIIFMSPIVTLSRNTLGIEFHISKSYVLDGGICDIFSGEEGGDLELSYDCKENRYFVGELTFTIGKLCDTK